MTRVFLALFALFGLIAQTAPAQARICGLGTEIGVVAQPRGAARALVANPSGVGQPPARLEPRDKDCQRAAPPKRSQVYVPSVQMGIDRAYE